MNGRLLETGWKPEDSYCYPNLSAYGPAKPVAYQGSPRKAFLELFGAAVASPEQLEKKLALNGKLMDFLTEDARRVEKQLSGDEKERFALYMNSFESLRDIGEKKAALTGSIREHAPELTDRFDSMAPSARIESHFEIATAALIAGPNQCDHPATRHAGCEVFGIRPLEFRSLPRSPAGKHRVKRLDGTSGKNGDRETAPQTDRKYGEKIRQHSRRKRNHAR